MQRNRLCGKLSGMLYLFAAIPYVLGDIMAVQEAQNNFQLIKPSKGDNMGKIRKILWGITSPVAISISMVGYALCNLFGYDPIKAPVPAGYRDYDYEEKLDCFVDIAVTIILLVVIPPTIIMEWVISSIKKAFSKLSPS